MGETFRVEMELPEYESMRSYLQVCMYDPKYPERIPACLTDRKGDFGIYYTIRFGTAGEEIIQIPITETMLQRWQISKEQLHKDAMDAGRNHGPVFTSGENMISSLLFKKKPENYFDTGLDKLDPMEPMYCLTNQEGIFGASLILDDALLERIGTILKSDYYVLPSSVHEVMIVPKNSMINLEDIKNMVHEINEAEVPEEIRLPENVQVYDRRERKIENALEHENKIQKPERSKKKEKKR